METPTPMAVVILAAGKGTRMKSGKAKVLHEVFFKPMLHHVLDAVAPLKPQQTVVIVGHQEDAVRQSLRGFSVEMVSQREQLGTGHAVQMTEETVGQERKVVMVLCGDTPLVRSQALQRMYVQHQETGADLTVMTTRLDEPFGYGRIISTGEEVTAIVEEKEADEEQKKIKEINAGIYLVDREFLYKSLGSVTPDNTQGEFYLTDIVEYCVRKGKRAAKFFNPHPMEVLGVNSRVELEAAHMEMQKRRNAQLMGEGVTIVNSATVRVSPEAVVEGDAVLAQNVQILGATTIGAGTWVETGAILENCAIGRDARVGAYSVLRNMTLDDGGSIPPMTLHD